MPWWGVMILCVVSFYLGGFFISIFVLAGTRMIDDNIDETHLSGL